MIWFCPQCLATNQWNISSSEIKRLVISYRSYNYSRLYMYNVLDIWEHIWEKVPIGNWSHHVGFILELCSKYEIISWHIAKGYILQCFWSSRDSSTLCFNILRYLVLLQPYVQYRLLCPIYGKICQYPEISLLLAFIKKYVDKKQIYKLFYGKFDFHEILWRLLQCLWK